MSLFTIFALVSGIIGLVLGLTVPIGLAAIISVVLVVLATWTLLSSTKNSGPGTSGSLGLGLMLFAGLTPGIVVHWIVQIIRLFV